MVDIFKDLFKSNIFLYGLILKSIFVIAFFPEIHGNWFLPFYDNFLSSSDSFDPWTSFYLNSGDVNAFPYGPVMFLIILPLVSLGTFLDSLFSIVFLTGFLFKINLLLADIFLLCLLIFKFENFKDSFLKLYWLSPIVVFITYWHGQLDIIPIAIFFLSAVLISDNKYYSGSFVLALSVIAKHSMLIGIPFILIYVWYKTSNPNLLFNTITIFLISILLIEGPLLLSSLGFEKIVLSNREIEKIFWLSIPLTLSEIKIYILPLTYLILLFFYWKLRRINFELLNAVLAFSFAIVIILTPAPASWFIWLIPFFSIYFGLEKNRSYLYGYLLSMVFLVLNTYTTSGSGLIFFDQNFLKKFLDIIEPNNHIKSLLYTVQVGLILIIIYYIFREGISRSNSYILSKKPIVVGISGDIRKYNTMFIDLIDDLFGKNKTIEINAENYKFQNLVKSSNNYAKTHQTVFESLNMINDLRKLINREIIDNRYLFSKIRNKLVNRDYEIIFINSPNNLVNKNLFSLQDFSFNFGNKSTPGNEKICLRSKQNIGISFFEEKKDSQNLTNISISFDNPIFIQHISRILIGVCGLQVETNIFEDGSASLTIFGELLPEDTLFAIKSLIPNFDEFIPNFERFYGGSKGILQMIFLIEFNEVLVNKKTN